MTSSRNDREASAPARTDAAPAALSGYRIMWMIVLFDR
jgi:hypothetical protein